MPDLRLYWVYDKRDRLTYYICHKCIEKHLDRREGPDMSINFGKSKTGQCPSYLHEEE